MLITKHFHRAALAFGLAICSLGAGAAKAEITLSYSPWNPATYGANDAIFPWFKKVSEVTENRVRIEPRAAAVGAPRDQADAVSNGLVDMSLIAAGYTPGRYPMMELFSLPLLSEDGARLSQAASETFDRHFATFDMFDNAVPLTVFVGVPAQLAMIKTPATEGRDLTGKKLYISNRPTSDLLSVLGASPVSATVAEVFGMASGGIIDGAVFGFESTQTFGLKDYLRHFTLIDGGLGQASWALLVNRQAWEKISPEDQAAIMAISGPVLAGEIGAALMSGETRAHAALLADGATAAPASEALMSELRNSAAPIYQSWEKAAAAGGLSDPAAVLAELRDLLR